MQEIEFKVQRTSVGERIKFAIFSLIFLLFYIFARYIYIGLKKHWLEPLPFQGYQTIRIIQSHPNQIKYEYCDLYKIDVKYLYCLMWDYSFIQKYATTTVITKEFNLPIAKFRIDKDTKIILDNTPINKSELQTLQLYPHGIPIELEIKFTYDEYDPKKLVKIMYTLIKKENTLQYVRNYRIEQLQIKTILLPSEYFNKRSDYVSFLEEQLLFNFNKIQAANKSNISRIICSLQECINFSSSKYDTIEQLYKLSRLKTKPESILQDYCKIKKAKNLNTTSDPLLATGSEAVDILTNYNKYLECEEQPPIIEIDNNLIKELTYRLYYFKYLTPFTHKMLIHNIIIVKHGQIKVIYDLETNELLTIFLRKLLKEYRNQKIKLD